VTRQPVTKLEPEPDIHLVTHNQLHERGNEDQHNYDDLMDLKLASLEEEEEEESVKPQPRKVSKRPKKFTQKVQEGGVTVKPFKCDYCKYTAVSSTKLELHKKAKHLRQSKYDCTECSFQANRLSEMKVHQKTVHKYTEGRKTHVCIHCNDFVCSNKKTLDHHIISVHKNVRKYHCDECNYTSNYLNNFQRHTAGHQGILGNYLCPHCPKAFYVEAKLRSHMLVHTDDKNYVCDECAAKFKRKDDLKVHMRTHLPDEVRAVEKAKKLTKVCETCGKKFEKNWKLKRHMIVHNKETTMVEKTAAPRWQSSKMITLPEEHKYIVITSDAKFIETVSTDKYITGDRIVIEPKFCEEEEKFITVDGKIVTGERVVFNQIQYTTEPS